MEILRDRSSQAVPFGEDDDVYIIIIVVVVVMPTLLGGPRFGYAMPGRGGHGSRESAAACDTSKLTHKRRIHRARGVSYTFVFLKRSVRAT